MKGRKPKPTKLRIIEGNPGKRPLPKPEDLPALNPIVAPSFLTGYAREEWYRVVAELEPLGVLSALDVAPLASYCMLYERWREAEETIRELKANGGTLAGLLIKTRGSYVQQPLVKIALHCIQAMNAIAADLYLQPVSRQRLFNDPNRSPIGVRKRSKFDGLIGQEKTKF